MTEATNTFFTELCDILMRHLANIPLMEFVVRGVDPGALQSMAQIMDARRDRPLTGREYDVARDLALQAGIFPEALTKPEALTVDEIRAIAAVLIGPTHSELSDADLRDTDLRAAGVPHEMIWALVNWA